MCEWVWIIVNSSVREEVLLSALEEAVMHPLLKEPLLDQASLESFLSSHLQPLIFKESDAENGCMALQKTG